MDTKAKHTPGPWKLGKLSGMILTKSGTSVAAPPARYSDDQWLADARLIAAAPDLLEALEQTCERLEHFLQTLTTEGDQAWVSSEVRSMRAAIAKARGQG